MPAYLGDLTKTQILGDLFEIPKDQRDGDWQNKFCANVADASFACGNPQVIQGPDGFHYFQLNTPEPYKEFQCFVIQHMKDDFLLKAGYGIVINANKGQPDWVFSHGDIVNYHLRKEFYTASDHWSLPKQEIIEEDEEVLVGQPSESLLPGDTRTVIRNFLQGLGINDGKLLLLNRPKSGAPEELVFNLTPDKFGKQEKFESVMRSISWFLPRHYRYVSMPEASMKDSFEPV
jgi:hypothetical protein